MDLVIFLLITEDLPDYGIYLLVCAKGCIEMSIRWFSLELPCRVMLKSFIYLLE